ncbi:NRDE family protein [Flavobacterium sp. XGLA_31]|uniref:NRDE family protein n=1 Tax=Flavobacterium sp. XGLA_31 TaxID=3447666 RepID=UPI003F35BF85
MCTVSFVNANGKFVITSNRDEKTVRPHAVAPKNYCLNNKQVIFPKDSQAGGTWYAIDERSNVVVLLNGASEKHEVKESYRQSRGLVVLELMENDSPLEGWKQIDLSGIEPFTLVLFEQQKLYQLRWNELEKETLTLDTAKHHIWSSSTLYSKEIRAERAQWFADFILNHPHATEEELFGFHRYTEEDNTEHGLVINRKGKLKTVSITQTVIEANKVILHYADLINEKEYTNTFISV